MTTQELEQFLTEEVTFTFAKTMAAIPHSWICRKDWGEEKFFNAMNFINDNGYVEIFFNRPYVYYKIGEYKYWVATDRSGFEDRTAIINRAKV